MKRYVVILSVACAVLLFGGQVHADRHGGSMMKGGEDCPLKAAGKDCPLESKGMKDDCPKEAHKDCDRAKSEECEKERHHGYGDECPLERYTVKGQHKGSIPLVLKNREALKVTDEQMHQLVKILMESKKAKIRKKAELEVLEIDLKAELHKSPVDLEKASALLRETEKVKADIAIDCLTARENALKVLNDDQKKKLKGLAKGGKRPSTTEDR